MDDKTDEVTEQTKKWPVATCGGGVNSLIRVPPVSPGVQSLAPPVGAHHPGAVQQAPPVIVEYGVDPARERARDVALRDATGGEMGAEDQGPTDRPIIRPPRTLLTKPRHTPNFCWSVSSLSLTTLAVHVHRVLYDRTVVYPCVYDTKQHVCVMRVSNL